MDIPLDARDAAQAAARREGLSLGEWLTRRILKRYSELSVQEREDAFNQLGQRVTEMCDRLERMEGSARSEPLREAVKKLHQGLGRLSADLVQTTGESTIRMSALSRDLENLLGKIEEIGGAASRSEGEFRERIEAVRQDLDVVARGGEEDREILTRKFEKLGQTFEEAFSGVSRNAGALQSEMVRIAQGVQALESRIGDAKRDADESSRRAEEQAGRVADRLENFGIRLDRVCAATAESATSLQSRIGACEENLVRLDTAHNAATARTAAQLEAIDERLVEAAADASGMCSALDHRLLLVQQGLQALDQRQTQTADALAQGRSWVAEKIAESRAESLSACAALDARLETTHKAVCDLDRRHSESVRVLAGAHRDHEMTAAAVDALEGSLTALGARVGAVEADGRLAEHESRLTDLAGRTNAAETVLASHHEKLATVDGILDRLGAIDRQHGEMLAQVRCDFEQHLQQIVDRTEATERAVESRREKFGSIDAIIERLDRLDTARIEAIQALEQTRGAVGALQPLEGRIETLQTQIASAAAEREVVFERLDRLVAQQTEAAQALEQTRGAVGALQPLEGRIETLQTQLASVSSERERLSTRLDDLSAQQTESMHCNVQARQAAEAREAELASRFDDICNRTQALETSLDLVQEHTKAVGDLLTSLDARISVEANKQDDVREGLKSELLEEISRSLFAQLDAEARKQEQAIEELHAAFAASTRKALDAKLEEDSRSRQHSVDAEVAPSALLRAAIPEFEASPPPVIVQNHVEPEPAAQGEILDLVTPAADEARSGGEIRDSAGDHHEQSPPPFPEPGLVATAAMGALSATAAEALEPAMAFASEQAGAVSPQASFLSAARQSLRESAQKSETESDPKSLLRFSPFRQPGSNNKRKSDPTSYALLAGVALVAIVAIAVTTGELVKRSHVSHAAAAPAVTAAVSRHAAQRHAVTVRAAAKLPMVEKPIAAPKLKQLANAGDPQAQLLLGLQEIGTDTTDAAKWLGAAAQQGMPVAQYRVATLYAQGRGVPADPVKAFHWYAEAAKGGNRKAMSNLAVDYAQGSGTAKDPEEAARWFSRAAELGLVDAQFDLAVLYERGLGVPQSLTDAYRWYLIAAKAGDRESKDRVDALVSQLSPTDRAAAEAAAARFEPQPMNASANEPQ